MVWGCFLGGLPVTFERDGADLNGRGALLDEQRTVAHLTMTGYDSDRLESFERLEVRQRCLDARVRTGERQRAGVHHDVACEEQPVGLDRGNSVSHYVRYAEADQSHAENAEIEAVFLVNRMPADLKTASFISSVVSGDRAASCSASARPFSSDVLLLSAPSDQRRGRRKRLTQRMLQMKTCAHDVHVSILADLVHLGDDRPGHFVARAAIHNERRAAPPDDGDVRDDCVETTADDPAQMARQARLGFNVTVSRSGLAPTLGGALYTCARGFSPTSETAAKLTLSNSIHSRSRAGSRDGVAKQKSESQTQVRVVFIPALRYSR